MTRIIEVARFRVRPGCEQSLTQQHGAALRAVQRAFPGLQRIHVVGPVVQDFHVGPANLKRIGGSRGGDVRRNRMD
jgi:hypothetical protein